jgi:diadenosine tetraphosphate (Ap4A) HIT family hydrolase
LIIGFDVPHFHYHLVPTDSVEDIRQSGVETSKEELQQMQEQILSFLIK